MKILFAWELGGNLGHILRQRQIAAQLRQRGHQVVFAAKNVALARQVLADDGHADVGSIEVLQAPAAAGRFRHPHRDISSYADMLMAHGFGMPQVLQPLIDAWLAMFREVRPDVVVLDHSPAALFAARLCGVPSVNIGTGFEIPPALAPFPDFRPWLKVPKQVFLKMEAGMLEQLNALAQAHRRPPFARLADCLRADRSLLLTFKELDHYPERSDGEYLGPLFSTDLGADVVWPATHAQNVLVYLRPNPELETTLASLAKLAANVVCVIPGISSDVQACYAHAHMSIYSAPVKLATLLTQCDLVVSHLGHGLLSASVLAGVPVLGIPTQIEQMLLGQCAQAAGVGRYVPLNEVRAKLDAVLVDMLGAPSLREKSVALAARYPDYDQVQLLVKVASQIESL